MNALLQKFTQQAQANLVAKIEALMDQDGLSDEDLDGLEKIMAGEFSYRKNTPHCTGVCGHVMAVSTIYSEVGRVRTKCPKCEAAAKTTAPSTGPSPIESLKARIAARREARKAAQK